MDTDTIKTINFAALPALGAALEGGKFYGVTTLKDGTHAAVILLPNKAQERMTWDRATAWASEAGGVLPSRPVSALLYANAKDKFEPHWYWTSETLDADTGDKDDASCAWNCYLPAHQPQELRRLRRRRPLDSFGPLIL
jgi:hypothetical protein